MDYLSPNVPPWWVDWTEGGLRPSRLWRSSLPLPWLFKIIGLGDLCQEESYYWRELFNLRKSSLLGVANICSPNVCSSHLPLGCLPPFEALDSSLVLLNSWYHISFHCLTLLSHKFLWGSHTQQIKFVNLSHINLIIRPAKEPRREEGRNFSSPTYPSNCTILPRIFALCLS